MGRTRQLSIKECYELLHLQKGADLQAVKSAYRKRAFELHPDLNPGNAEASRQFQLLNEAYVALSAMLKPAEEARQKAAREKERQEGASPGGEREKARAQQAYAEQDVLRDLLNDPFARRVFEDIYSELAKKQQPPPEPEAKKAEPAPEKKPPAPPPPPPRSARVAPLWERGQDKGVKGAVKDWLRRQIDEEQTLVVPAHGLAPGRKIRLQIRQGLSENVKAVEVTLPRDFVVGKPVRLRGLGKRVGPWQGDLYLTINTE